MTRSKASISPTTTININIFSMSPPLHHTHTLYSHPFVFPFLIYYSTQLCSFYKIDLRSSRFSLSIYPCSTLRPYLSLVQCPLNVQCPPLPHTGRIICTHVDFVDVNTLDRHINIISNPRTCKLILQSRGFLLP